MLCSLSPTTLDGQAGERVNGLEQPFCRQPLPSGLLDTGRREKHLGQGFKGPGGLGPEGLKHFLGGTWRESGPSWGPGGGKDWALQGQAQVCRRNLLTMTCVTCQGQMEAPSVPSEPGSCASQVLKAAPPPRPPRPRGRGTGWLSGQEASGISEPRVQVLPVILSNYFFFLFSKQLY